MAVINIAIIGAAGFVGMELVNQLEHKTTYNVYGITRDNGNFLLEGKKIQVVHEKNAGATGINFDYVINLAYPTSGKSFLYPQINKSIISTIAKLVSAKTKIIHVSTQAVFGFGMDVPVKVGFLPNRRDFPYIEAKLSMENSLKSLFPRNDLSIIRLGNVWGPGSGSWTATIAEKLLFGQFVEVEGLEGYSNITDVKNIASYIIHLIEKEKVNGQNIYHLAEFGNLKWSYLVKLISDELNVTPVASDTNPSYSISLMSDILNGLKITSVGDVYRELVWRRFSGSYLRSVIRTLGTEKFQKLKNTEIKSLPKTSQLSKSEVIFLKVIAADVEFKSVVDPSWTPLITFDESWKNVKQWMTEVGYIN